MEKFFNPQSIAIFGVSSKPSNLALGIIYNLVRLGYAGRLYALGSRQDQVSGIPIHTSLDEVDDTIDLAVMLLPASRIPEALEACGRKGIGRVIIEAGGFREFTDDMRTAEEEILAIAERYGMRIMGPNCIGTVNVAKRINLDFASMGRMPRPGPVGIIAQSGGITLWFANLCSEKGLGMALAASVGNKLDVNEADVLEYYLDAPEVHGVLCYLESIADGPRLMELARISKKPIAVYKANTSAAASRIAASHTAAILSDDRVVDQAFRQSGIWRVRDAHELDVTMRALRLKACRGNRMFVIARSGGHAVMAADAAARYGFELVTPSAAFYEKLERIIPTTRIIRQNPLDIGDVFDLARYKDVVEAVLALEEVDAVVFLYLLTARETTLANQAFFNDFAEMAASASKPFVLGYFVQGQNVDSPMQTLPGIVFETPDEAIAALAVNRDYWRQRRAAQEPVKRPALEVDRAAVSSILGGSDSGLVSPSDALATVEAYGVPVAPWMRLAPGGDPHEASKALGFPLVAKLDGRDVVHKSDEGFVVLDVGSEDALHAVLRDMETRYRAHAGGCPWPGAVLMSQVAAGIEVIVGARRDPTFGPVVMFGLGGVLVEAMESVAMRICPVDETMALEMMAEIRGGRLLSCYRGSPPVDRKALAEVIVRVARLVEDHPEIVELDLNPVIASAAGAVAVDARIVRG